MQSKCLKVVADTPRGSSKSAAGPLGFCGARGEVGGEELAGRLKAAAAAA